MASAIALSVSLAVSPAPHAAAQAPEAPEAAGHGRVNFVRDIQPIFAEHCWRCHGGDESTRESGLRLDQRDGALAGGDSGTPAIVAGQPDASHLLDRVRSEDPDLVMPPAAENDPLTPRQIELLAGWIQQGAEYETHWAFIPPRAVQPTLAGSRHPIDALVESRWAEQRLTPRPRAPLEQLGRRLYLDLIGLPPSPSELDDLQRDGYLATVDKLLASERFGEKWARHWLDVARYSDTNGYEKDLPRDQWIYRDWVIDAFNRDMPYKQFLIEQLAGDLLPSPTQDQIIATGFLRNSMLNEEGAIIPEQFRMVEMFDRLDCLGKSVLGLTTQCAQCHDHKFDPLSQEEYYGLFAFLNSSYEALSWVYTPEQLRAIERLRSTIDRMDEQLKLDRPNWADELESWRKSLLDHEPNWVAVAMQQLESESGLNHPVQHADGSITMLGHTSADVFFVSQPELNDVTGLRLEILTHGDLPQRGPGRNKSGTWDVNELLVFAQPPGESEWTPLKLTHPTADFSEPERQSGEKENQQRSGPVELLIDGDDKTRWTADRGRGRRNQPSVAVVRFENPLEFPASTKLKVVLHMEQMVGCCRISLTRDVEPAAPRVDHAAMLAMRAPSDQWTAQQWRAILWSWRRSLPDQQESVAAIDKLWADYPEPSTSVMHLAERPPGERRVTYLLDRGAWDQPKRPIEPATPAILNPFPEDVPRNRLGLAMWLTSEDAPLTARVAVNRVWQAIFVEGLVRTPEDFGTRAPVPEHPELLDWLAVEFMRHDWSHKHLIRLIVTSDVYQRDSRVSPAERAIDPDNRWLARGPRFRADAEVVRDIALSASGLLTNKRGGPSVIPPVPKNVLDYNFTYPAYWKPAEGAERYRRTVYGFRKRSMPDPVMSALDGPNGEIACPRRVRSNTPIAALAGLNEPIFVEAARALAQRVLREGGDEDGERVDYAFRLCTARHPTEVERAEVLRLLESRRQRLRDGWLSAREIATGETDGKLNLPDGVTPIDAAAWTLAARVLLNLDETISKN